MRSLWPVLPPAFAAETSAFTTRPPRYAAECRHADPTAAGDGPARPAPLQLRAPLAAAAAAGAPFSPAEVRARRGLFGLWAR